MSTSRIFRPEAAVEPTEQSQPVVPMDHEPADATAEPTATATAEPPAKRLKVGQISMLHVDETDLLKSTDIDVSMFEHDMLEHQQGGDDGDNSHHSVGENVDDEMLWLPYSEEEPSLDVEQLSQMDRLATMGVH